ncbi:MAG TPA: 2-amino-4-hydroxy-6-hydroxymethyldihydropteridine diphosphokinase [Caulobacteraceae bacterium]|jgi:2-amino-4-hydroxy-6-hydroxymethyldihydropteridine diphosphokinase
MDARDLDAAVIIALGSNLAGAYDSSTQLLQAAIERLPAGRVKVVARSPAWRSAAWPDPAVPTFVNAVVLVETDLSPRELLASLRAVEREFGRTRGEPNAPRTLDLDLIAHGRVVIAQPDFVLPHPRAHERYFVMGPLAQIAPAWRHPVSGRTAAELAGAASVGLDAAPTVNDRY